MDNEGKSAGFDPLFVRNMIESALRIAETIRSAVQNSSFEFGNQRIGVTVSIGIATFPDHAGNIQDLIAASDAGLYEAKQTGRNRVIAASTESSRQMQPR